VSKQSDVETVETVEGAEDSEWLLQQEGKPSRDLWTRVSGVDSLGGQPIFLANCGQNSRVPLIPGCRDPRVLNGIIESKKSAEWWNVINDENHEWTDSPKHQES
jgi:hypothetical protein